MKDKIATILSAGPAIEKIVVNEDTNKDCLLAISLLLGAIDIVDDSATDGIIIERQDSVTNTELNNPKLIKIGIALIVLFLPFCLWGAYQMLPE